MRQWLREKHVKKSIGNSVPFWGLLLCLLLVGAGDMLAQPPHDTKGKEFWVTFMQNHGSGGDFERSDLRLYVSSDTITTVRVHYAPLPDTLILELQQPNVPFEIDISGIYGGEVELSEVLQNGSNAISQKSFHITSDAEITLYGVNIRVMSADAFLALPDDALTGRYIVTAWPNGFLRSDDYDMHSEFAVIGTEDGTTVRITPSTVLNGQTSTKPFTVGLNRGDVYFGQAQLGLPNDVTGTEIRANKPVAVYAGNQRTSVPTNIGNFRDHLVEQIPPIDAWGETAILTPHYTVTNSSIYQAEARVLAAFDNTEVTVTTASGSRTWTLDSKIPLRISPLEPAYIESTQPILVAQFEHSVAAYANGNEAGLAELGDPFMMLIPAPEQYDTAYAFQSVSHDEFLQHYINVIVPNGAERSLVLDGEPISRAVFTPIPGRAFQYAQIRVSPGSHYIRADKEFGLCVYGYGRANSYGYTGGTLFRTLVTDFERPSVADIRECDQITGVVTDDGITDTGIDSCYGTKVINNARLNILPFIPGADTVRWNAQLIDPYQDGLVEIKALDQAGRSITYTREIPGFTVAAVMMAGNEPIFEELVSFNGEQSCDQIALTNYGKFPQTISSIVVHPDTLAGFTIQGGLPMTIGPGDTRAVSICYEGTIENAVQLDFSVGNECITRNVALVNAVAVVDTVPPSYSNAESPCSSTTLTFAEPDLPYLMVESMVVDTLINGRYSTRPSQSNLPARTVAMQFSPVDFREDMIYQVSVWDAAGNQSTVRDTIGGFTVAVYEEAREDRLAIRLNTDWNTDTIALTTKRCDSLDLTNYGSHELTVTQIIMDQNQSFSIPPAQLPITLRAGETKRFAVCLEGRVAGEQTDTLLLLDECGRWENVLLRTPVESSVGHGSDLCGNLITMQSFGAAKRTFLGVPAPNPVSGRDAFVDLGLKNDEIVTVSLIDFNGAKALRVIENVSMDAGVHRVAFSLGNVQSGVYFCRMETATGDVYSQKMIVRE